MSFDLEEKNRYYLEKVEGELKRIFDSAEEDTSFYPTLRRAMLYSVSAGGKRLRPCLTLAVCDMLGGDMNAALPVACAIEMIHTYSLIHDDLPCMDDDDMRRGKPSNHKVFGEAMAVLAGDGLLSFAFETMLAGCKGLKGESLLNYVRAMHEVAVRAGARGMVTGQAADIEYEGSARQTEDMLHFIHTHKTADMLCAAVLAGAHIAGADEAALTKLGYYSRELGMLFQITDDLLDMRGDQQLVGKTLGKDAAAGKLTYASLYGELGAVAAANEAARRAKEAIAGVPNSEYLQATIDNILIRSY